MKALVSEQELREIVKQIVQTGTCGHSDLALGPEQRQRVDQAFEIYKRRDKTKPLQGTFPVSHQTGMGRLVQNM